MDEINLFEMAARYKWRFPYKGSISAEDLWDLSPESLDLVFKALNAKLETSSKESLLRKKTEADAVLSAQIDIVKHIVNVKLTEKEEKIKAEANRERRQTILEIIADKQAADLKNKSIDELTAMLNAL